MYIPGINTFYGINVWTGMGNTSSNFCSFSCNYPRVKSHRGGKATICSSSFLNKTQVLHIYQGSFWVFTASKKPGYPPDYGTPILGDHHVSPACQGYSSVVGERESARLLLIYSISSHDCHYIPVNLSIYLSIYIYIYIYIYILYISQAVNS